MTRFSQYWVDPDAELQQIFDQEREIKETQIIKNQISKSQGFLQLNLQDNMET